MVKCPLEGCGNFFATKNMPFTVVCDEIIEHYNKVHLREDFRDVDRSDYFFDIVRDATYE